MVENQPLMSRSLTQSGIATVALVLGIVSIFMPFLGIILGILAIIFGSIALHRKTTHRGPAITGIITGAVGFLGNIGLIMIITFVAGGNFSLPASDRDTAVAAQISEKKDFTSDQTVTMGPIDINITNVQRDYVPTPEQVAALKGNNPNEIVPGDSRYKRGAGVEIPEDDAEYVLVQGTVQENGSPYLGDYDLRLDDDVFLNNVAPYDFASDLGGTRNNPAAPTAPTDFSYVFRIRKTTGPLVLTREVSIWKKISWIVGTEGMPRADLVYTITLK